MEENKKIIVKAVYGAAIKTFRKIIRITYDEGQVLGCTLCRAKVKGSFIEGVFDKSIRIKAEVQSHLHIWYEADNDTKVIEVCTIFSDYLEIDKQGFENYCNEEVFIRLKEEPKCLETIYITNAEKNQITVQIEYTLEAEVIGDTVLNVKVFET